MAVRRIETQISHVVPDGELPLYRYINQDAPAGVPNKNFTLSPFPVIVTDVRGTPMETIDLDQTGFQYLKHQCAETRFDDDERIKSQYYDEVKQLLLDTLPGAKRIEIWDHTLRTLDQEPAQRSKDGGRGPVHRVHVDQTEQAAVDRVRQNVGGEADRLLKGRVRIVNVWRPLHNAAYHDPLGVVDWRSVDAKRDLLHTRRILPGWEGSLYNVAYNEAHQWYYMSAQRPDEVLLLKCYDSAALEAGGEAIARATPHSSFSEEASDELPRRQSIEVRCIVFDIE
ncbi:hypothetical protein ACQY0O_002366 [Thecaphora frezii]